MINAIEASVASLSSLYGEWRHKSRPLSKWKASAGRARFGICLASFHAVGIVRVPSHDHRTDKVRQPAMDSLDQDHRPNHGAVHPRVHAAKNDLTGRARDRALS